jgi:hypothetical protein
MRKLLGILISLVLILELRGLAIANPSVDNGHTLAPDAVDTVNVVAQRHLRICDNWTGVWDITIQKGSGAISGSYTDNAGCTGTVTGQKTGRKLDLTVKGLAPCRCFDRQHTVVTKPRKSKGWEGTNGLFDGTSDDCKEDFCCYAIGMYRCKK